MARFRITYYKNSFLASVFGIAGSLLGAMGGLLIAVAIIDGAFDMILGGLVCLLIAAVCGGAGSRISAMKSNKTWWNEQIHKQNREREIVNSVDFCFQVYNANPNTWTLEKIEELNAGAAAQIRQALAAKK